MLRSVPTLNTPNISNTTPPFVLHDFDFLAGAFLLGAGEGSYLQVGWQSDHLQSYSARFIERVLCIVASVILTAVWSRKLLDNIGLLASCSWSLQAIGSA